VRARKRDAERRPAESTPSPSVSARIVVAQHPLLLYTSSSEADSAPQTNPGKDARPSDPRPALSGLKPGEIIADLPIEPILSHLDADGGRWVVSVARSTHDDVEAIAQRLAALLLRGGQPPCGST
jgi:hypothetical protein